MTDEDLAFASLADLAAAIRRRHVSSVELLDLYLARCERWNGALNAIVTIDRDRALKEAKAADLANDRGAYFGPLHGVPLTVKDALATAGARSTGGAIELSDHVPARDAAAVARLRAAGAIVLGKTNVPRWSSDFQTYNEIFGTTRNPWDLGRTPGGSSGGGAAAVAAGLAALDLGTDIAGSLRVPATFCGVFALKPSFRLVPTQGYLDRPGGTATDLDMNVVGVLARSIEDLDIALSVLVGRPHRRPTARQVSVPPARRLALANYRIGVWMDDPAWPRGRRGVRTPGGRGRRPRCQWRHR